MRECMRSCHGSLIFLPFFIKDFNCYPKSTLTYFYKKDSLLLTIRPSHQALWKDQAQDQIKKDALQIQWLFEAINAEAWEISAFGLLGFKAITSRSSQFYALYTR